MKSPIFLDDLRVLPNRLGLLEEAENVELSQPVMTGRFNYHTFDGGLSMHTMDAEEQQNNNNRLELQPGLSFNFIFRGRIDYTFAGQHYRLEPRHEQPICSTIINKSNEFMTRNMSAKTHIEKVNVYAQYQWLESRCETDQDWSMMQQLFSQTKVQCWTPTPITLAKARSLLSYNKPLGLTNKLEVEQLTIDLLSASLEELMQHYGSHQSNEPVYAPQEQDLKQRITALLSRCRTLSEIAASLNMSERSLQRKFKLQYRETAAQYVKMKRLELSKRALIIEKRSIGEAAYLAGYNHASNYINAFKREYGITPSEFSARHQGLRR